MKFITEAGAVIDQNNRPIVLVGGEPSHVDFPTELIWDIHQKTPGFVWKLAHTHPPRMYDLSKRDEKTLQAWAWALDPYPITMSTITLFEDEVFIESEYVAYLEPKEMWRRRKKRDGGQPEREFIIQTAIPQEFTVNEFMSAGTDLSDWRRWLISKSYEKEVRNA